MDIVELTIKTLDSGNAAYEVNKNIKKIVEDVLGRSDIGAARKVKLEISIKPKDNPMDKGELLPEIDWNVSCSIPPVKGGTTCGYVKDGTLKVRNSGDNPMQSRFEDMNATISTEQDNTKVKAINS